MLNNKTPKDKKPRNDRQIAAQNAYNDLLSRSPYAQQVFQGFAGGNGLMGYATRQLLDGAPKKLARGGKVGRGDGCCIKGHTKGKM